MLLKFWLIQKALKTSHTDNGRSNFWDAFGVWLLISLVSFIAMPWGCGGSLVLSEGLVLHCGHTSVLRRVLRCGIRYPRNQGEVPASCVPAKLVAHCSAD